ncbi:transcription factor Tat-CT1 [Capsaspora owczarzaki ATCC 30864]|uniref:Transcription elongation factor SPT5 n=1 Tax=Capsaspora owczarzaki (strain ATCC 30864) TaxID=595528 RepID=A0A0D2X2B0_CAPO3|nr:transcription factor Tat-CT1 [Capsaspora owczarzaki ATCC 30864]KJE92244.1 transcription factor Tat-CT1 [Capsaspora owczarzaki ATCC 30864]|eukprot:XP_004364087.1 transcription factor Tat-CT1 [Capsaspora owczarzaki ATCC 30864]
MMDDDDLPSSGIGRSGASSSTGSSSGSGASRSKDKHQKAKRTDDRRRAAAADDDDEGNDNDNDDDEEGEDEDDDDDEGDDDDDDDDDEDDEDDDDDNDRSRGKKRHKSSTSGSRKRRKGGASNFVLEEAEVGDEDEEDEDDTISAADRMKGAAESIPLTSRARDNQRDVLARIEATARLEEETAAKRAAELERRRALGENIEEDERMFAEEDEEQEDEYDDDDIDTGVAPSLQQQAKLPTSSDPQLYLLKCRIGHEQEAVLSLMRRAQDRVAKNLPPLGIVSVIARNHIRGFIYVEAYKNLQVQDAIKGLSVLGMAYYKQQLIPHKDMPDVLSVVQAEAVLKVGAWVRLKKLALYKKDLGVVVSMEADGAYIKIIPRVNLQELNDGTSENKGGFKTKAEKSKRPQPVLLDSTQRGSAPDLFELDDESDSQMFGPGVYRFTGSSSQNNMPEYVTEDGFMYKFFKTDSIDLVNVNPTIEELKRFNATPDELRKSDSISAERRFVVGDRVEVTAGELQYLTGIVRNIDGDAIFILPTQADFKEELRVPASLLRKAFILGDHIKVIAGNHEGETGLVTRVDDKIVTFVSDLTMKEMKVFAKDSQIATEVTSGLDKLGQFELYDLVQLDPQTVACITKIEKDSFKVLDQNGSVQRIEPRAISQKRNSKFSMSLDGEHNSIQADDIVKIMDGAFTGRQGTIKHIYRSVAFVHCREVIENSGILVCRTRGLLSVSGKGTNKKFMDPAAPFGASSFVPASPRNGVDRPVGNTGAPTPAPAGGLGRGRGARRHDEMIGKSVVIRSGPYKGLLGIVKDATETVARVELHTKAKTVSVDKAQLRYPSNPDGSDPMLGGRTPAMGGRTPAFGGQTPSYGGQTPSAGNMTPSHGGMSYGSMTPHSRNTGAWDPSVTNQSRSGNFGYDSHPSDRDRYQDYNPGSVNSYSQTPGMGSVGPQTPMNDIGTPAGTPGVFSAPTPSNLATPGGYHIPSVSATPGPHLNAYTPAPPSMHSGRALDAMTPAIHSAPTPMSAMTPGAMNPMTPAALNPMTPAPAQTPAPASIGSPFIRDAEVTISRPNDPRINGHTAVILEARSEDSFLVNLLSNNEEVLCSSGELQPVAPSRGDDVYFTQGPRQGQTGSLVSLAAGQAIVTIGGDPAVFQLDDLFRTAVKLHRSQHL